MELEKLGRKGYDGTKCPPERKAHAPRWRSLSAGLTAIISSRIAVESSEIPLVQESKTVRHLNTSEFFIITVQTDSLNCRLTPVNGKVVKRLSREQSVQVVATDERVDNDTWYKIATGDCWVNGRYLSERITDSFGSNISSCYTPEEAELEANIVQSQPQPIAQT